jgi:AraC-like DNA-binding protein
VGLAPKRWVRVARFNAAAQSLAVPDRRRLADLAHDHGYADQAHLTREFGALAGVPPSRAWWA